MTSFERRVLIVDDETEFLMMLREALEVRGFKVDTATNGVECGLSLATNVPDLIFMDVKMRGINGLQACGAIRKNPATSNIPLIIVSALSGDSDIKKAKKAGATDYIVKPVNIEELVKKVRDILHIQ